MSSVSSLTHTHGNDLMVAPLKRFILSSLNEVILYLIFKLILRDLLSLFDRVLGQWRK